MELLVLLFLYWKLLGMDTDDATESTNLVDDLTLTIKEDAGEWEQSSNMMHGYKLLHETPGGVQLFVNTTMLLFENPSTLHKIATFVARMEKYLHRIISMTPQSKYWVRQNSSNLF